MIDKYFLIWTTSTGNSSLLTFESREALEAALNEIKAEVPVTFDRPRVPDHRLGEFMGHDGIALIVIRGELMTGEEITTGRHFRVKHTK